MSLRSCIVLAFALASGPCLAESVVGRATAHDGDTISIGAERIRLFGIDAPELDQDCERRNGRPWACGRWSRDQLRSLIASANIRCTGDSHDKYGRLLARCEVKGLDIAEEMVRLGAAEAYRRYSTDYVDAEKEAVFASLGIWQGRVEAPEAYRAASRSNDAAAEDIGNAATDGCVIKGNISGSGRIYHLPGQENYTDTRIDPRRGERWFCSEAEAVAAGWRRARR
jgi:endonuclease YncB( thermonuclease family)